MSCCQSCSVKGTNEFFTEHSKRYLKQFRKKGLAKEQRLLVEGISRTNLRGASVLEIGCGVGGLHLTLLQRGASHATGVDISEGMIAGAKQLSHELALAEKTEYHIGDIVAIEEQLPSADIIVLDKVVCCYEDINRLLEVSGSKSTRMYAFSYPNPNFLVALSFYGLIFFAKMFSWKFRPYWHDWSRIISTLETYGFKQTYTGSTIMWNVCVLERV